MRYDIHADLPVYLAAPLRFREAAGNFEGEVNHPLEIVERFEPIDVLNGAMELVDRNNTKVLIEADSSEPVEKNEYPSNYQGIFFRVIDDKAPTT